MIILFESSDFGDIYLDVNEVLNLVCFCFFSSVGITFKIDFLYVLQIVLTHEHADAVLGLDDIRAVQPFSPTNDINPTPIYLTQFSVER